jgi:hypothetical protein
MSDSNLPAVANGGDIALPADNENVAPMIANLAQSLSHRAQAFDGIECTFHNEVSADGATKSCFNFRAYKHRA